MADMEAHKMAREMTPQERAEAKIDLSRQLKDNT